MDGFKLDVQTTRDAVCVVVSDDELSHATSGQGFLRRIKFSELPRLKNGEPIPRLLEVLELPAKLINIELKGEPGWKNALAAVEASDCLGRVIFSSAEHSEILQLWAACPQARCGFIWETDESDALTSEEIFDLPKSLLLHIPLCSVGKRPDFWKQFAGRLVVWGAVSREHVASLGLEPHVCIMDV
jgi:glycerophosphoryl diester phosphodiesterase